MKRSSWPLFGALALSSLSLPAQGGRQLFEVFGIGQIGAPGYGTAVTVIGDQDGDGVVDFALGDINLQISAGGFGAVEIRSGADASLLLQIAATQLDGQLGRLLAAPGDVNGDQVPDVLAASNSRVVLLSGFDGSILRAVSTSSDDLAGPGDWNGDQVPDLAYLSGGTVQVISGFDGSSIASLGAGASSCCAVEAGAGMPRMLAVQDGAGITLFQSNGAVVWSRPGYQRVESGGDLNGDQLEEVLATSVANNRTDVLSGFDGSVLRTLPRGECAAGGVDLNGDGVRDFVVGDGFGEPQGLVRAFSGVDGSLLFARVGQEGGEAMGFAVAMHPGFGTAARPVALVGSFSKFNGSQPSGAVLGLAVASAGELDGSFRIFGQFCNYISTRMRPGTGRPTIGQNYGFRFDNNTQPMGFEFLVWGYSNQSYLGVPLPLQLPSVLSCAQLFVSADATLFTNLSSFQGISIPLMPGLVGAKLYVQGVSWLSFPVVLNSDAGEMTIGN